MKFKSTIVITVVASIVLPALSAPVSKSSNAKIPTITIHAMRYAFRPAEITLKQGEAVRLIFIADDVPHGLSISDLGLDVNIEKKKPGQVVLTPKEVGDFSGRCSWYCGAGHSRMTFQVHVTP